MEDAAKAMVERLEAQYSREHLGRLAYAGGWEKDVEAMDVSARELAALEELEEDE
jgi:hypothetical protein